MNEVEKLFLVFKVLINMFVWYNIIYDRFRDGDMVIFIKYWIEIKEISKEIELLNFYFSDVI